MACPIKIKLQRNSELLLSTKFVLSLVDSVVNCSNIDIYISLSMKHYDVCKSVTHRGGGIIYTGWGINVGAELCQAQGKLRLVML